MKLYSWNVNGIRAVQKKGFNDFLENHKPDVLCLQETKAESSQLDHNLITPKNYQSYFCSANKKGYSGVATYTRQDQETELLESGIGIPEFDTEGRFLLTRHGSIYLYNIYFPSGTTGDLRQTFKYNFLDAVYEHLAKLPAEIKNNLIICGDLNICHRDLDIHHPEKARKQELSGFLEAECLWVDKFLACGFIDTFRFLHPELKAYSWWSYRAGARKKNLGWRIDYFFAYKNLSDRILDAGILTNIQGSDHCPVWLEIKD
jgi:exodeoxyribonuclease-3